MKYYLRFKIDNIYRYCEIKTRKDAERIVTEYQDYMTSKYYPDSATGDAGDFLANNILLKKDMLPGKYEEAYVPGYSCIHNYKTVEVEGLTSDDKVKLIQFFNSCYYDTDSDAGFFATEFYFITEAILANNFVPVKLFCVVDWEEDFKGEFPEIWKKMEGKEERWSLDYVLEGFKDDLGEVLKEKLNNEE